MMKTASDCVTLHRNKLVRSHNWLISTADSPFGDLSRKMGFHPGAFEVALELALREVVQEPSCLLVGAPPTSAVEYLPSGQWVDSVLATLMALDSLQYFLVIHRL